jgi:SAM-dependent methyltransferase
VPPHPSWVAVQERLAAARTVVDLGCGGAPVAGATAAVDRFLAPEERALGAGATIDPERLRARGIRFVSSRIDAELPFRDREFDFAYSAHAFEHLEDPALACREMQRIARAGVIITPSILAEHLFGRPYHRWLVMGRERLILFFRKRPFEDRPFGEHPRWDERARRWRADQDTNPFDMLLNESGWYRGSERAPRLRRRLRHHWFSHSPVMEMIFLWEDRFECHVYE